MFNISATLTISQSTLTGNSAYSGGGVFNRGYFHTVTLHHSLLSGNSARDFGREVYNSFERHGTVTVNDYNLFGLNNNAGLVDVTPGATDIVPGPGVSLSAILNTPLADNGGPTKTNSLVLGSPAIDAFTTNCPATDQRGVPRPQGPACDIGAFERGTEDTINPSCTLTAKSATAIQVTARDTGTGLAAIQTTHAVNATVNIPSFTPGTTAPVVITATKIDTTKSASIGLQILDREGNSTICDPVLTVLEIPNEGNRRVRQTFTELPQAESLITLHNGDPGLKSLSIIVNGEKYQLGKLKDNEETAVDVGDSMVAGDNTITLIGHGQRGASASVTISESGAGVEDTEALWGEGGPAEQLQVFPPGVEQDWQQHPEVNWVWGNQVEP